MLLLYLLDIEMVNVRVSYLVRDYVQ